MARSFQQAQESPDTYVVALGLLDFDPARLPVQDLQDQTDRSTTLPARLTGQALTSKGFIPGFAREITINARCFGPWCASAKPGTETLVFLKRTEDAYELELTPCGGFAFPAPSDEGLARVDSCFAGKGCAPAD